VKPLVIAISIVKPISDRFLSLNFGAQYRSSLICPNVPSPNRTRRASFSRMGKRLSLGSIRALRYAGWSQFVDILAFKAEKAGQRVVKVDPKGTSQHCAVCLNKVPKELSQRWHSCSHCGHEMDRDTNAAILIKKVGLGIASLKNAQPGKARKRSPLCIA
jgi:putative transposase